MSDPIDSGDAQKPTGLKAYSLGNLSKEKGLNLDSMKIEELLALRDEIDAKLPRTALKDINLEEEMVLQYQRGKALQAVISQDETTPANQRAQIANSVRTSLTELVKLQSKVYNAEQFRLMEAALAKALRTLPEEAQVVFYEAYQREAKDLATVEAVDANATTAAG